MTSMDRYCQPKGMQVERQGLGYLVAKVKAKAMLQVLVATGEKTSEKTH